MQLRLTRHDVGSILGAVDTFLLRVHQRQVAHQCHAATQAAMQMRNGLNRKEQEVFWAGMQNFLTAIANISKACWGQGGRLAVEREPLWISLGITDTNPMANTDLRNHLEHYDERLDRWYTNSASHNHVDYIIGPSNTVVGVDPTDIFRHFDPSSGDVIFWGEHYSIPTLIAEVQRLLPMAEQKASKPHWDRPDTSGRDK